MSTRPQIDALHPLERLHGGAFRAWVPAVLWMLMIAFGGGESLSAAHTQTWLAHLLAGFHLRYLTITKLNFALRKSGHFCVYATLSLLLFRAWRATLAGAGAATKLAWSARACVLAIAATVLVAALDEFHQSFSHGRTSSAHDVVLDTFGAVFAQMVLIVVLANRRITRAE